MVRRYVLDGDTFAGLVRRRSMRCVLRVVEVGGWSWDE